MSLEDSIEGYSMTQEELMSPSQVDERSITASTPNRAGSNGSDNDDSHDDSHDDTTDNDSLKHTSIPKVTKSMTPWRQEQLTRSPSKSPQNTHLPANLETRPVNFKTSVSHEEFETLQSQLKRYKIQISALEEIIKNINLSKTNSALFNNEDNRRFLESLLQIIDNGKSQDDINQLENSLNDLYLQNDKLRIALNKTEQELKELRLEYDSTLQDTEENLKDYERLNSILNSMLQDLVLVMENDSNSEVKYRDIIPDLQNAMKQESSFVMNKILKFQTHWMDVIDQESFTQRKFLPIDGPSEDPLETPMDLGSNENANANTLTPESEKIIEDLHKQYADYMVVVKEKVHKSLILQRNLLSKIQEQDHLIAQLSSSVTNQDEDLTQRISSDEMNALIEKLTSKIENQLTLNSNEFNRTIKELTTSYQSIIEDTGDHYKSIESDHLKVIDKLTKERDILTSKLDKLRDQFYQHQRDMTAQNDSRDLQFSLFRQNLATHLTTIINILEAVIEKDSITKSLRKILYIKSPENGLDFIETLQTKLDSLMKFDIKALEFLTKSYIKSILNNRSPTSPGIPIWSQAIESPVSPVGTPNEQDYKLRIKELQKRWAAEREGRSIENQIANQRIDKLQRENEKLKEKLAEMSSPRR